MSSVQFIGKEGSPEWAILSYDEYMRLSQLDELAHDIADFQMQLDSGEEELIPQEYAKKLIEGESPIGVWRKYRGMNQGALAQLVGISKSYLSQIESGKREASVKVLRSIASCLEVSIDDLIM